MTYKKKHFTKLISCLLVIATFLIAIPTASATQEVTPTAMDPNAPSAAPFGNGTYYISSSAIRNFMQIDDNVKDENISVDEAKFEMWGFSGEKRQKWRFTHLGNSCFKIENVASGKCIAVDPDNVNKNGASLIQKNYVNDPTMQWYVYKNPDDVNYKITPMINNYVMAISVGVGTNGRNVQQRDVSNPYQWYIYDANNYTYKFLNTKAYYDINCNYTANDLAWYYEQAANAMQRKFHIRFNTPEVIESEHLECSSECDANNPKEVCTSLCGPSNACNSVHHRSGVRLLSLLSLSGTYVCRFTSYDLCKWKVDKSGIGEHIIAFGMAERGGNDSIVSTSGSEDLNYLIQHELSHNLGTLDNTDKEDGDGSNCTTNQSCVMKGNANCWCDNCLEIIRNNY